MDPLQLIILAADLVLMGAVVYLIARLRRLDRMPQFKAPADVEEFLSEASRLTGEFDRLLKEKRDLVTATVTSLDQRIAELKSLAAEVERSPVPQPPPPEPQPDRARPEDFRKQVLAMAKRGRDAAQIARATGRPQGEVELVLGLGARGK